MVRWLALPAALAGCFDGNSTPGDCRVQCSAEGTCPGGYECADDWCRIPGAPGACADASTGDGPSFPDAAPLPDAPPNCGDQVIDFGEECDDGNKEDGDACVRCRWARCGDGAVRTGVEHCDDGDTSDGGACAASCLRCGDTAARFTYGTNGHCYFRIDAQNTWARAQIACRAVESHLASIASLDEDAAVVAGLSTLGGRYWIGFHDNDVERQYVWDTGEPFGYTHWRPGEPNGSGDCGEYVGTNDWNDAQCSNGARTVCEEEAWHTSADNSAFRVFHLPLTADAAESACQAWPGGRAHLASILSAEENAVIVADLPLEAWLGARGNGDFFSWIGGEPVTYDNWAPGEPASGFDCVKIAPSGEWHTASCDETRAYLCEIP